MDQRTREKIAPHLCGRLDELAQGRARRDGDHIRDGGRRGGPRAGRTSAQVKFLGPVVTGDRIEAEASVGHILDARPTKDPRR
jgi:hypothetical protein